MVDANAAGLERVSNTRTLIDVRKRIHVLNYTSLNH